MIGRVIAVLVAIGFRCWKDIDFDGGWTLQRCAWTGEKRTVAKGVHIRRLKPTYQPRWKHR